MASYRYIGYGTTNANGVATLDHDANGNALSHSYTGVGAGEIDFVASTDSTITSISIVSEPFGVLDCIFYDEATTNAKASSYSIPSNVTVSYSSNGATLTKQSSGSTANKYYVNVGLTGDWEAILNITSDGNARVGVRDSDGAISVINQTFTDNIVRVRVENGNLTVAVMTDGEWVNQTLATSNADLTKTLNFTIYLYNTTTELNITYSDLKIYPI